MLFHVSEIYARRADCVLLSSLLDRWPVLARIYENLFLFKYRFPEGMSVSIMVLHLSNS